jgi:hypothetical protein
VIASVGRPGDMFVAFRKLTYGYHDSLLERCQVGPQQEVILEVRLDPVWNRHAPRNVRLRFGAIQNFEEVRAFFERVQEASHQEVLDEVVGIVCRQKGRWVVDLARNGAVTIATPKIPQEQ